MILKFCTSMVCIGEHNTMGSLTLKEVIVVAIEVSLIFYNETIHHLC